MVLRLPSSYCDKYYKNYWPIIKEKLKLLSETPTLLNLESTIKEISEINHCAYYVSVQNDTSRLSRLFDMFTNNDESKQESLIKIICDLALRIEELFPSGTVETLQASKPSILSFKINEIHCLLAHMFLGTFLCCPENDASFEKKHARGAFSFCRRMSLVEWFSSNSLPTTDIYIHALLNMFDDMSSKSSSDSKERELKFERKTLNFELELDKCDDPLIQINVHAEGRIGDVEEIEVDFANACVGGGPGGTQEELLLGISPESLPIAILNEDPLKANESIIITGAKKYAEYRGFGLDAKYTGKNMQDWDWGMRKVIAIDAIGFEEGTGENRVRQMKEELLKREITKCHIGFIAGKGLGISTGHWGCGAFGGDKEIKAIIQLIGASIAGVKHINYYAFGDKQFANDFSLMLHTLYKYNLQVKDLWKILLGEGKSMKEPKTFKERYDPDPFLFKRIIFLFHGE